MDNMNLNRNNIQRANRNEYPNRIESESYNQSDHLHNSSNYNVAHLQQRHPSPYQYQYRHLNRMQPVHPSRARFQQVQHPQIQRQPTSFMDLPIIPQQFNGNIQPFHSENVINYDKGENIHNDGYNVGSNIHNPHNQTIIHDARYNCNINRNEYGYNDNIRSLNNNHVDYKPFSLEQSSINNTSSNQISSSYNSDPVIMNNYHNDNTLQREIPQYSLNPNQSYQIKLINKRRSRMDSIQFNLPPAVPSMLFHPQRHKNRMIIGNYKRYENNLNINHNNIPLPPSPILNSSESISSSPDNQSTHSPAMSSLSSTFDRKSPLFTSILPSNDNKMFNINHMSIDEVPKAISMESHRKKQLKSVKTMKKNIKSAAVPPSQPKRNANNTNGINPLKPFECIECGRCYKYKSSLKLHSKIHSPEASVCGECGKKFAHPHKLKIHIRSHTGERPYKCSYNGCNKAFSDKSNLNRHFRIHTGEKPYECEFCKKRYSDSSALVDHRRRKHTKEKPYHCIFDCCGKSFAASSDLTSHLAVHNKVRPFACDLCQKKFKRRSDVHKHMAVHRKNKKKKIKQNKK